MKKYEAPVVELEVFSVENVMTGASGNGGVDEGCANLLPEF